MCHSSNKKHVCVQVHKMYAGMLDVYLYNGNRQALDIAINMTDVWLIPYVSLRRSDMPRSIMPPS